MMMIEMCVNHTRSRTWLLNGQRLNITKAFRTVGKHSLYAYLYYCSTGRPGLKMFPLLKVYSVFYGTRAKNDELTLL